MGATKYSLLGFPLAVLVISLLIQTGSAASSGQPVCFNPDGSPCAATARVAAGSHFQTTSDITPCTPLTVSYSPAPTTEQADDLCSNSNLPGYPHGFSVAYLVSGADAANCGGCNSWLFPNAFDVGRSGATSPLYATCTPIPVVPSFDCTLTAGYSPPPINCADSRQGCLSPNASTFFNFSGDYIAMLVIAVGVVAIAGITVFGSGENSESVHIIFIIGLLLGIWGLLSVAEGSLAVTGPTPGSIIGLFNKAAPFLGTAFYGIMALFYLIGSIGFTSRGF